MKTTTFLPHPIRVEAVQLEVDNLEEVAEWCNGSVWGILLPERERVIRLNRPDGEELTVSVGGWIVSHPTLGFSVQSDADFKLLYFTY